MQMQNLINKYRENPAGIRNDSRLVHVCIRCGSTDVRTGNDKHIYFKICNQCGNDWYHNHCWSCSTHQQVDSRDSENYICPSCGWVKCTCGACRHGCKLGGHYDNNHALEPTEIEREKIEAERASLRVVQDQKRQKIAEYEKIKKDAQDKYHNYAFQNGFFSGLKKVLKPDYNDKSKENERNNIVTVCDYNISYLNNQEYGTFDTTGLKSVGMVSFNNLTLGVDLSYRPNNTLVNNKVIEYVTAEEADAMFEDSLS